MTIAARLLTALLFMVPGALPAQRLPIVLISPTTFWVPDLGVDPRFPPLRHQGKVYFGVKGGVAVLEGQALRVERALPDGVPMVLSPTVAGGTVFGLAIVRDEIWAAAGTAKKRQLLAFDAQSLRPLGEKTLATWSEAATPGAGPAMADLEVHTDPFSDGAWLTGRQNLIYLNRTTGLERQTIEELVALTSPAYLHSPLTISFDQDFVWLLVSGQDGQADRWLYFSRHENYWRAVESLFEPGEDKNQLSRDWIWTHEAIWGLPNYGNTEQESRDFLRLARGQTGTERIAFKVLGDYASTRPELLKEIGNGFDIDTGLNHRAIASLIAHRDRRQARPYSDRHGIGRLAIKILELLGLEDVDLPFNHPSSDKPDLLLIGFENRHGIEMVPLAYASILGFFQPEGRDPLIVTARGAATVDGDQVTYLPVRDECLEIWDGLQGEWRQAENWQALALIQKKGLVIFDLEARQVRCGLKPNASKIVEGWTPAEWGQVDRQGRSWKKTADGMLIRLP